MKKLVKILTQDNEIKLLIDKISKLENDINNDFNCNQRLKWTIFEYQQYLEKIIVDEVKKLKIDNFNIDNFMNKALIKFSAIFPPSIGDYRIKENWSDYRSVAAIVLQNSAIKQIIKEKALPFLQKLDKNSDWILNNNKNILTTMPLFEFEIIDLIKRAILSFFGGLENINSFDLSYSKNHKPLLNNIQYCTLEIDCLCKNKLLLANNLIDYWNKELLLYEQFIDANLFDFGNINVKVIWGCGAEELQYYKSHWIIDGKFKINYHNKSKNFINQVIDQMITLMTNKSKKDHYDEILEKIWNNKVIWEIKQYERLVSSISRKYFNLSIFKNEFNNKITKINVDKRLNIKLNNKNIEDIFRLLVDTDNWEIA